VITEKELALGVVDFEILLNPTSRLVWVIDKNYNLKILAMIAQKKEYFKTENARYSCKRE
jgi:hypothetical protein